MNCDICFEPFDHSIRKPYSLMSCPHTYCLKCSDQFFHNAIDKCPQCKKPINGKNLNIALLKLIPESSYDRLKAKSLKVFIELNETKQNLKKSREEKLNTHVAKIQSIKQKISDKTTEFINFLKANEKILTDECDLKLNEIKSNLDSEKFEDNNFLKIESKDKIEKNELNEVELNNLNDKIPEFKEELNKCLDKVENYEIHFNFIENKISNDALSIGKFDKVNNYLIKLSILVYLN